MNIFNVKNIFTITTIAVLLFLIIEGDLNATRMADDDQNICAICLDDLIQPENQKQLIETPCHHVYHLHCLRVALAFTHTCPLCQHNFNQDFVNLVVPPAAPAPAAPDNLNRRFKARFKPESW